MDQRSRLNPASAQDARSQRQYRRLRLPWLDVSGRQEMATQEKPPQTAGQTATANAAHQRAEPGSHHGQGHPILRGWRAYFKESHPSGLSGPDGWMRRRLRAMLRKREKRPGYGLSKADSQR